eukprot:s275_g26.t1
MQSGWGIQSEEQVLILTTGLRVPIELQKRSVMVRDELFPEASHADSGEGSHGVCAVHAEVADDLRRGPVRWQLDRFDLGVGRHCSDRFQELLLARAGMSGNVRQQVSHDLAA